MKTNPKTYHSVEDVEQIRRKAGWSIEKLADAIGISPAAYHLWKHGGGRYESSIERTEAVVQKMLSEIGE